MKLNTEFILASQSPRRRRLLERIGMTFDVFVSNIDETISQKTPPAVTAEELALRKARSIAREHPTALTLGADTIVVLDDEVLGKPEGAKEARDMLRRLSGRTHIVYTGIALVHPESERAVCAHEATNVTFAEMSNDEIAAYVATGSPMDKAGGYGIQDDRGALFVRKIDGDYYNVVGLPLHRFYQMLKVDFRDLLACDYLL